MRLILALLVVHSLCGAALQLDKYGKSDSQILAMGGGKWADYCLDHSDYKKAGERRAVVRGAMDVYWVAARRRNDELIGSPKLSDRTERKRLCELVIKYGETMMSLYRTMGGNNFMEELIAETECDAQDAIFAYLHPKGQKRAKPHVVSDVTELLQKWQSRIDEDNGVSDDKSANQKLAAARSIFHDIVLLVSKTTDRAGSDQILGFCVDSSALEY